jgi:hypothetical protein
LFAVERWRRRRPLDRLISRETAFRFRFEILALVLVVLYLISPDNLLGATLIYHRFLPPAYAILAIVVAPRDLAFAPRLLTCVATALVPIASMSVAWPIFVDADRISRDIDDIASRIAPASAIAMIEVGPHERGRMFWPETWGGHIVAQRGGRELFDFTQSPISPAFLNPAFAWNEEIARFMGVQWEFEPGKDFDRFRYAIVHSTDYAWGGAVASSMNADARIIAQRGEWFLLESNHHVVPLETPDGPRDARSSATLRVVVRRFLEQHPDAATDKMPPAGALAVDPVPRTR